MTPSADLRSGVFQPGETHSGGSLPVLVFFVLACAFSWAYWVPVALWGSPVERGDGWPTHVPGLLGPLLAAFVVLAFTEGRGGLGSLLASMVRWPRGARSQLATAAPLVFLAFALVVTVFVGAAPEAADFLSYSGTSATAVALVAALLITGFGEETGWRGYALARLQRRHGSMPATLMVTAGWAVWHLPLFFLLASYADFGVLTAVGWLIGLTAGGFVLTAVFNETGGSVLAVALWHAAYDAAVATDAGDVARCSVGDGVRHRLGGQPRATPSERTSSFRASLPSRGRDRVKFAQ